MDLGAVLRAELLMVLRLLNPWLDEPEGFAVEVARRIAGPLVGHEPVGAENWPVKGKAHLLVGARQTGKTTWLWRRFQASGIAPLFLNGEEPLIREWMRSSSHVVADLRGLVSPETPVFLDEAQHLDEAGLLIKGLVDAKLPNALYITGSSAFHLQSKTRESLAGRAVRAEMHPLSLRELRMTIPKNRPSILAKSDLDAMAERQVVVGGYPEAWLSKSPELVLRGLVEAFVIRDASDLFQIRHLDAMRRLMELIARHCGDLVNLSEWASIVAVNRQTVSHYIDLLAETRIIAVLPSFNGDRRSEITGRPKVFFRDVGVRNAVLSSHATLRERTDRGAVLETWVAGELLKTISSLDPSQQLYFWRSTSGAEVDFVVRRGEELCGWEVKAAHLARPTLTRSARSFIEAYEPVEFTVLNLALTDEKRIGRTRVRWVTPAALADEGVGGD